MAGQKREARLARVRLGVPAIHVFDASRKKGVDARHKAGHDECLAETLVLMVC
jgi:hypothetical protein